MLCKSYSRALTWHSSFFWLGSHIAGLLRYRRKDLVLEKIRLALVSSYAGVIIVGWTLAQGVANAIGVILTPVVNVAIRFSNQGQGRTSVFSSPEPKIFDSMQLSVGAIKAVVVLAIGLMLLKWLYIRPAESSVSEAVEAPE